MIKGKTFSLFVLLLSASNLLASKLIDLEAFNGKLGAALGDVPVDQFEEAIEFAKRYHLGVTINPSREDLGYNLEMAAELAKKAFRKGVPSALWVSPKSEGLHDFSHQGNAPLTRKALTETMDFLESNGFPSRVLVVDLEPPVAWWDSLAQAASEGGMSAVVHFLKSKIDREGFYAAKAEYAAMLEEAHARGFFVVAAVLPMILDDLEDGDETIQQMLHTPVDGLDWDVIAFQVYRSLFIGAARQLGIASDFTPYLVASYARTALERYGERAAVVLGTIKGSIKGPDLFGWGGYDEPAPLLADLEAALSAGLQRKQIHVFALSGILGREDKDAWLSLSKPSGILPPPDRVTEKTRALFRLLDALTKD